MDLQRRSAQEIPSRVQDAIDRALGRQRLRFAYRSPSQIDAVPRVHTVEPWDYLFDTKRGHYYLEGYRLQVEGPYGLWDKRQWQPYRPERIDPATIQVLPDRLPPTPPKRPRLELEYWLAPAVARLGQITQHFTDMQIHETDDDDWVRVTAATDNLFLCGAPVAALWAELSGDGGAGGAAGDGAVGGADGGGVWGRISKRVRR